MKILFLVLILFSTISCNAKKVKLNAFTYDRSGGGDLEFTISREANDYKIKVTRENFESANREMILLGSDPLANKIKPIFDGEWRFEEGPKPEEGVMGGTWLTVKVNIEGSVQEIVRADLNHKDGFEVLTSLHDFVSPSK